MRTGYPGLPSDGPRDGRQIATVVNNVLRGGVNWVLEFDVPADVASLWVDDARISELSVALAPIGSSVTVWSYALPGRALVGVTPGPARREAVVILG
jgi:hypothetical protein